MPALLIGYDVECPPERADETGHFLKQAYRVHTELGAPCTLFVMGKTLESNVGDFQRLRGERLFDFQQHTYSHILLKTVVIEHPTGEVQVVKGGSLEQIREEVDRTNRLLLRYLAVTCLGITGPWGYYRGLSDRPDVLEILHNLGMRFTRTYARNKKDYQPVALKVQPFWYEPQGLPDILEIPVNGWQDVYLRGKYGWKDTQKYLDHVKKDIDYVSDHDLTYSLAQHDWTSILEDPEMTIVQGIIQYAQGKGLEIMSYNEYYERLKNRET